MPNEHNDRDDDFQRSVLPGPPPVWRWPFAWPVSRRLTTCGISLIVLALVLTNLGTLALAMAQAPNRLPSSPSPRVAPPPSNQFVRLPQPWKAQGPFWLGTIALTNTSGHYWWDGYVILIGGDDVTCANSPYQSSAWRLDLAPEI